MEGSSYSIETKPDYQTQIWFPMTESISEERLGTNMVNTLIGDIMKTHETGSNLVAYTDMFKMITGESAPSPVLKVIITFSEKTDSKNVVTKIDEMTKKIAERLMHSFDRNSIRIEYPERTSYLIRNT